LPFVGVNINQVPGILRGGVGTQPEISSSSMRKAATCFSQVAALLSTGSLTC
jgi:hypothetical protein